jgi:hypothetical protein
MNNPPAFPHTVEIKALIAEGGIVPQSGMTLRDYFAAKAMQGYCLMTMTRLATRY